MSEHRDPNVIQTPDGFERLDRPQPEAPSESQFFACYAVIETMTMDSIREKLWKLDWPYERIAVRVLDWEEAVTRLAGDVQSMMAMTRMVVAIEDIEGNLYLVRTPDLVTGVKAVHRNEDSVQAAVNSAFKLD